MQQFIHQLNKLGQGLAHGWLKASVLLAGLLAMLPALAIGTADPSIDGSDIGAVAVKLGTEASSVKTFLWAGAQVAGVIIAIAGIQMWVKAAREDGRHSHGRAIFMIVIGSIMFFLPTVMGIGAASILGDAG